MGAKQKLTLSIDEEVVRSAKRLADEWDTSVSGLVEQGLRALTEEPDGPTPLVAELRGSLPSDVSRDEHRRHLEEKYLG